MFQPTYIQRQESRTLVKICIFFFPFLRYMNGHFMCRESIPVVTKNYIWHKNSDNEAAFLALSVKNRSGKKRKSQKQLVNNNHAQNNSCLQLLAWFYVPFSPLYSPLCLCHLTLVNLNEISQKVNNAVINSKEWTFQEFVIFSLQAMTWRFFSSNVFLYDVTPMLEWRIWCSCINFKCSGFRSLQNISVLHICTFSVSSLFSMFIFFSFLTENPF